MQRRSVLLSLFGIVPAAASAADPASPRYSSEAIRERAERQQRARDLWWQRERERQASRSVDRELERRRDATGGAIRRWEEQRERRLWGR